jgi:hypothetical protein
MSDATEQGGHPDASVSGDTSHGLGSSPDDAMPADAGPGQVGAELSSIKEHLRDLGTDKTLPPQERDLLRLHYSYQRDKLQLQLAVLEQNERVHSSEQAIEVARKALDLSRLEERNLAENFQTAERISAENQFANSEASHDKACSELQDLLSSLEQLRANGGKWEKPMALIRRWEVGRRWEAITPETLRPAVVAIREAFDDSCWRCEQSTFKLCFAALHPTPTDAVTATEPQNLDPYRKLLIEFVGARVQPLLLGADHPAPAIFKTYVDILETALKLVVRAGFQELFEIATARTALLRAHPVEWTQRQLEILIAGKKPTIRFWIKRICDRQDSLSSRFSDEEEIFWGSWRAPRLIHMQPAGNTPFDPASAWKREDIVRSEELLEGRAERLATFLRIDLKQVAGAAHVQFAKQTPSRPEAHEEERAARIETSPTQVASSVAGTPVSDMWRGFHDKFRALAEEELRLAPHNTGDRWLRAYVDYKDRTIACGQWHLSEGVNESFREGFEVEATRAGIALRSTVSGEAGDVWLHHVFLDLLEHKSKLLFAASKDGGIVVRVCEASALYSARLEKQALVKGRESAMPAVQGSVVGSSSTEVEVSRRDMGPDDQRNETQREAVIKKVQNPHKYKILSILEAALYFEVQPRTIYRWSLEGDLRAGARRGSITIESVLKLEKSRSRKRRDH